MPISDYTPTLDDVGALVRDRTVDSGGNEVGTFTPNTRPTDAEAQELINDAVNDAYSIFGEDIPDAQDPDNPGAIRNAAKEAVGYHAAALIELSHFGEQVARGNSPYEEYERLWEEAAQRVQAAIVSQGGTPPAPVDPTEGSMMAQFEFPEDAGGMVGWGTRW